MVIKDRVEAAVDAIIDVVHVVDTARSARSRPFAVDVGGQSEGRGSHVAAWFGDHFHRTRIREHVF